MGRAAWFRSGRAGRNRPLRPGGEFVPTGLHTSVASEGVGEKWTTVQTGELKPGIFHAMLSNWVSPKTSFEHAEPGSSPLSSKSSATTISWRHFLMCPRRGPAAPRSRRFAKTPPTRWRKRSWPILRVGDRSPPPASRTAGRKPSSSTRDCGPSSARDGNGGRKRFPTSRSRRRSGKRGGHSASHGRVQRYAKLPK